MLIRLASIIILGIGAQWLAWRLKFPSIIFLLLFGFIAGPVTGFLQPDRLLGDLLLPIVSISVSIILFEGGLTLQVKELRRIGTVVLSLISVGVIITWSLAALSAYYVLGLNLKISILLGAVLIVTGPTVIGPLLRHIRPTGTVDDILKWEGIVIDPIGALLAILAFEAILIGKIQTAWTVIAFNMTMTLVVGSFTGVFFALILILFIRKFWIPDFLHETVTLTLVISAYVVSDHFQAESGLFATTLMGLVLANQNIITVKHIVEFKENLRVLIISILFILLSARLDAGDAQYISGAGIIFLGILVFIARPAAVLLSTLGSNLNFRERLFLSWMAPRGIVAAAVASVFALRLAEAGIEQAENVVPLTFLVIIGTVVIYGLTSPVLASRLGIAQSNPQGVLIVGAHHWAQDIAIQLKAKGFRVLLIDTNRSLVLKARMAELAVYHGSVLSDRMVDSINLDGVGKLLALTSNDEVNSLATLHLAELFGREEMYQLPPRSEAAGKEETFSPKHLRGRYVFGKDITYPYLTERYFAGAIVKSTKLSKEFDYSAFQKYYGESAVPLFCITGENILTVITVDSDIDLKPGQTIIAMVNETRNQL